MMRLIIVVSLLLFVVGCELNNVSSTLNTAANLLNSDCYVEGALTASQYDDLPFWKKILYSKNSCGLYVKQDAGDIVSSWF